MAEIVYLNEKDYGSVENILDLMTEQLDNIESVAFVYKTKDGEYFVSDSNQKVSELSFKGLILQQLAYSIASED